MNPIPYLPGLEFLIFGVVFIAIGIVLGRVLWKRLEEKNVLDSFMRCRKEVFKNVYDDEIDSAYIHTQRLGARSSMIELLSRKDIWKNMFPNKKITNFHVIYGGADFDGRAIAAIIEYKLLGMLFLVQYEDEMFHEPSQDTTKETGEVKVIAGSDIEAIKFVEEKLAVGAEREVTDFGYSPHTYSNFRAVELCRECENQIW